MKRLSLGVVLATLAVYAWGMLYWGFNPLPYAAWQRTNDDVAAGQALLEQFPRSGRTKAARTSPATTNARQS